MGTIKFEIDLPEFEKELSINVTIHRDGEVVYTTTSSPSVDKNNTDLLGSEVRERKIEQEKINSIPVDRSTIIEDGEKSKKSLTSPKRRSGNMMNLDL